jgi:hypothetical protein
MFIVPIDGDKVTTADGVEFEVTDYSNFRNQGPCVYVAHESSAMPIYFFDIASVNGVKVEYNQQSKVLEVQGHFKRKIHLPQKHDKIQITGSEDWIKVTGVKLHSRSLGLSRGLLIIGEDGEAYSIQQIQAIKRPIGDSFFDYKRFNKLYKEYRGHDHK